MSGSPGSTVGKITLGGLALLLLGVLADISGLFSFATGKTLQDVFGDGRGVESHEASRPVGTPASRRGPAVGKPPATPAPQGPPPAYLNDLEPVGGGNSFDEKGAFSIDGHQYSYAMSLATSTQGESEVVEYALGGKYSRVSAVLGLRDDAPEPEGASSCHWRIVGDRKELKEGDTERGKHITIKSLRISGVIHLKIEATQTRGMANPVPWPCTIGDAKIS